DRLPQNSSQGSLRRFILRTKQLFLFGMRKQRASEKVRMDDRVLSLSQLRELEIAVALACKQRYPGSQRTPCNARQRTKARCNTFHTGHSPKVRISGEHLVGPESSQRNFHSCGSSLGGNEVGVNSVDGWLIHRAEGCRQYR